MRTTHVYSYDTDIVRIPIVLVYITYIPTSS